jgi:hypothetical protein
MGEGGCVFIFVDGWSLSYVGGRSHVWVVASFIGSRFRSGGDPHSYVGALFCHCRLWGGAWVAVVVTRGRSSSSVGAGYSPVGGHRPSCGGSLPWRSCVEWR